MLRRTVLISFLAVCLSCAGTVAIPDSTRPAPPPSELEQQKLETGIALHDDGKYREALAVYRDILDLNPGNVYALYESAFSSSQMGDYAASLDFALKGLEYDSPLIGRLSMVAANNLDILGKPKQAIAVYQKALRHMPEAGILYYNMGVTYSGMDDGEAAEAAFLKALERSPDHASSHVALADICLNRGEAMPAMLLLIRFLTLEPDTRRSITALRKLEAAMTSGVTSGGPNTININLFGPVLENPSTFRTMEMTWKLQRAVHLSTADTSLSALEQRRAAFHTLLDMMNPEELCDGDAFLERYLITWLADLREAGHGELAFDYIHQLVKDEGLQDRLKRNWPAIQQFEAWNGAWGSGASIAPDMAN